MKRLIKAISICAISLSMVACASAPKTVTYEKIGRVQKVMLAENEVKPSFVEVLAGATVGGLLGNQIGGGSGKYWSTAIGALIGAKGVDEALSERYKSIHYFIYFPSDRTKIEVVSKDLSPTIFKGDMIHVTKYSDGSYWMDVYGKYSSSNAKLLERQLFSKK